MASLSKIWSYAAGGTSYDCGISSIQLLEDFAELETEGEVGEKADT